MAAILDPRDTMARFARLPEDSALFGGTLPVRGEVRLARRFSFALEDPVLGRTIRHEYGVEVLPVA